ncbi:MAG: LuxR C-terminal-related transcriptional regulator [Gammaproteobacteria bacterium]
MENIFFEFFQKSISPSAIVVGPNYDFLFINEAWVRLFGFTREETIGRNSHELGISRNNDVRSQTIDRLRRSGSLSGMKYVVFSKSGREIHVINNLTKLTIDAKEYVLCSLHDITEYELAAKVWKRQDARLLESLTTRERDIIRLVVSGHSNKDIARILNISPRTVETHRSHCIQKLGTKSLLNIKRIVDSEEMEQINLADQTGLFAHKKGAVTK